MKNILAENMLRFGVKNLNHVDRAVVEHLMEVNPAGSTISPQTQAKIDAMIAASEALIAPIKGLGFVGTGQAAGTTQKVSQVKLGKVKDSTEVYVAVYWGSSSVVTYYFGALNGKPVVSSWEINGKYQSQAKPITAASVFEIGNSQGKWVGDYLAYNKNAKQWQTVADAITAVANKYIATGIATNESRIYEIAPGGGTMTADAQAKIDAAIAASSALVAPIKGISFKGTGAASGRNFAVSNVKLAKDQYGPDVYVDIELGKSSFEIYFGASTADNKTPVIGPNGRFIGDPRYANAVKTVTGQNVFDIAAGGYKWVKDYLAYEVNKAQWDKIAATITAVAYKYIASGGIATNESRIYEIAPAGGTMTPQGQAIMDKMIIDTQALAKGAVGVTFNDGTSQPIMKIGSATVEAVNPEYWKLNGAIRLVLNTNFGGMAKSVKIGLLADESNTVKIVGPSGRLLNLDAIGVKSALENWLGSPYQKMLDRSTALKPNPYKTLMDVLNGIAAKYKSTGLAAPTKG